MFFWDPLCFKRACLSTISMNRVSHASHIAVGFAIAPSTSPSKRNYLSLFGNYLGPDLFCFISPFLWGTCVCVVPAWFVNWYFFVTTDQKIIRSPRQKLKVTFSHWENARWINEEGAIYLHLLRFTKRKILRFPNAFTPVKSSIWSIIHQSSDSVNDSKHAFADVHRSVNTWWTSCIPALTLSFQTENPRVHRS